MVEPASVSTAEYAKTDAAVDSLADALADPEATADTEIDVPEALGIVPGTVFLVCLIFCLVGFATSYPSKVRAGVVHRTDITAPLY